MTYNFTKLLNVIVNKGKIKQTLSLNVGQNLLLFILVGWFKI